MIQFRLLGSVEADDGGRFMEIGHARQRCVLAALLVDANSVVSADHLVERVWGGQRLPAHPVSALQTYVSLLRRSVPESGGLVIARQASGYRAIVSPEAVDLHRFRRLANQARGAATDEEAAALFGEALGLWQGEAFAGLDTPWISAMRTTLAAERRAARLDFADAQLRQGQNVIVAAEMSGLAAEHPLDERIAGQYMAALHGSGRRADALAYYQKVRQRLAEELGADPGPSLQRLHQEILAAHVPGGRSEGTRRRQPRGQTPSGRELAASADAFPGLPRAADQAAAGFHEAAALVRDHLGPAGARHGVLARTLPRSEHVNLQRAIDAWSSRPGRRVRVHGMAPPWCAGGVTMRDLVAGDGTPPVRLTAPALADLPDGPGSALICLREALLLAEDAAGRYAVLIQAPDKSAPDKSAPGKGHDVRVEIAGLPAGQARQLLADLDRLRSELSVYRGRLLEVSPDPASGIRLDFAAPYGVTREDLVLPAAVLSRIERHALGVAAHRKPLLDAGQHLKRGLLLYGPPGTGKTHAARYLLGQMEGYTRLVLNGGAPAAVKAAAGLARALLPAVIVLEDVDLIARDRSAGPATSSALRDLLDGIDGAGPDADLLFLLTASSADSLDAALSRPGRVDAAVAFALPDAPARERLLALYSRGVSLDLAPDDITTAVKRTDGATASFLRELVRRSVQEALHDEAPGGNRRGPTVTRAHLTRALDELLPSPGSPEA